MIATVRVIMPIGSDPDFRDKQTAIDRGARAAGFAAMFPDYDPAAPDFDLRAALNAFQSSAVVLADLTNERPSCYYELGLAEGAGRPVVLVAAAGTDIHQSNFRARAFFYDGLDALSDVTETALRRCVADRSVAA